jgi:tetraacyldisaccharide 4'-kinase
VQAADSAELVGDEALMHYRRLSGASNVVVSRDRSAGCRFITSEGLGDVVVLDDGFQHRRLKRDLDIVLIDVTSREAVEEWKRGILLPAGPFREDKDVALSRADCVIAVTRDAKFLETLGSVRVALGIKSSIPVFTVALYPECFVDFRTLYRFELEELGAVAVRAMTGIAKPKDFFNMLNNIGLRVDKTFSYPDHHRYSLEDWQEVAFNYAGPIVTTAKDAVKLQGFPEHNAGIYILQLGVRFICLGEERRFWNMVESAIGGKDDSASLPKSKVVDPQQEKANEQD